MRSRRRFPCLEPAADGESQQDGAAQNRGPERKGEEVKSAAASFVAMGTIVIRMIIIKTIRIRTIRLGTSAIRPIAISFAAYRTVVSCFAGSATFTISTGFLSWNFHHGNFHPRFPSTRLARFGVAVL